MNAPPLSYRCVSAALAPVLAAHTLARALRDGGRDFLVERYGFVAPDRARAAPVWIHCASVGEVTAAAPLAREFAAHGIGPLLVTTVTPTGRARASRLMPAEARLAYLPVDRPGPVRRFLERSRPRIALIVETELWPHLFAGLHRRGVPIAIVNGRLSRRTREAPAWWRRTAAWCLGRVDRILARSQPDHEAFLELGARAATVQTLGNLKLAASVGTTASPVDLGMPFVLAASTHADEEERLAQAWHHGGSAAHLLVIAPRHPERGAAIARALRAAGFRVARRSLGEAPASTAAIYLADTLGELEALIAGAEAVIMGGSLIPRGGQNVLEPARAGRPIVCGPHMENFADETALLEAAGGLMTCADEREAVEAIVALLQDPDRSARMGRNARETIESGSGMAGSYREALSAAFPGLKQ